MINHIQLFLNQVVERSPLQFKSIQNYIDDMGALDRQKLERRIQYFLSQGETYETIADGYLEYCFYFMEERKYFIRNGTYRYTTAKEAAHLYENREYARKCMIGLSMAVYLWKMQRDNMHFFIERCQMDNHQGGTYLEVGSGHGEYLVTAVENTSFDSYYAIDISYVAAEMTKTFCEFALQEKEDRLKIIKVENKDFFDLPYEEKFDAIVMSEVIEHVENPNDFLMQIKKLAKKDTFIYLSTAINSPFPDHLYHFHNKHEVYSLIEEAGLKIVDETFSTAAGITLEKAVKKIYDITVCFVLSI